MATACEHHCPFLNRSDTRCSEAFSLNRLGHAYHYCFGRYKACPTYLELLVERRMRRSAAAAAMAGAGNGVHPQHRADGNSREATAPPSPDFPARQPGARIARREAGRDGVDPGGSRFVPLTISAGAITAALAHGHAQRAA